MIYIGDVALAVALPVILVVVVVVVSVWRSGRETLSFKAKRPMNDPEPPIGMKH